VRAAIDFINRDRAQAARIFVEEEKSSLTAGYVQKLIESPSTLYSAAPVNSLQFAEFMSRTGRLKNRPGSWRDYFFPDAHGLSGT
jgi:NitT/TauT family transport system substrate-binding protein